MSLVAALIAVLAGTAPSPAQELPEVTVISFPGRNNWRLWAAQARGEFAKNGIRIALTPTPDSVFLMRGVIEGKFDIALLRKNIKSLTPELAEASASVLLDPTAGLQRNAELDIAGLRTILGLRSEYGRPQKKLTDPLKYYDPTYYRKATAP